MLQVLYVLVGKLKDHVKLRASENCDSGNKFTLQKLTTAEDQLRHNE